MYAGIAMVFMLLLFGLPIVGILIGWIVTPGVKKKQKTLLETIKQKELSQSVRFLTEEDKHWFRMNYAEDLVGPSPAIAEIEKPAAPELPIFPPPGGGGVGYSRQKENFHLGPMFPFQGLYKTIPESLNKNKDFSYVDPKSDAEGLIQAQTAFQVSVFEERISAARAITNAIKESNKQSVDPHGEYVTKQELKFFFVKNNVQPSWTELDAEAREWLYCQKNWPRLIKLNWSAMGEPEAAVLREWLRMDGYNFYGEKIR